MIYWIKLTEEKNLSCLQNEFEFMIRSTERTHFSSVATGNLNPETLLSLWLLDWWWVDLWANTWHLFFEFSGWATTLSEIISIWSWHDSLIPWHLVITYSSYTLHLLIMPYRNINLMNVYSYPSSITSASKPVKLVYLLAVLISVCKVEPQ